MASESRRRWRILALLALAEVLGMSVWFAASAVAPELRELWDLDASQAGWITTAVQFGFVAGTAVAAILNVADVVSARAYFGAAAALAGVANAAVVVAPGYRTALAARFATGFFLAGVYPPAMKMLATWFQSARGLAIGTLIGALTVGKALPYLIRAVEGAEVRDVLLAGSVNAVVAAGLVVIGYRDGPFPFERRPFSLKLSGTILRHRATRLAIFGYLGHMWELYAMWTWAPAFVAASMVASRSASGTGPPAWFEDIVGFGAIAAGGLGCVWAGWTADRIGRERVVNLAMAVSGLCSLVIGLTFGASPWLVAAVAWTWGFFVVADSAQFSTLVTEVAPRHAVGTALTLQTSMGFLLTIVTIQLVPEIVQASGSWRWAFPVLALGPAAGIVAIRRLEKAS
jgi:MFS family permease